LSTYNFAATYVPSSSGATSFPHGTPAPLALDEAAAVLPAHDRLTGGDRLRTFTSSLRTDSAWVDRRLHAVSEELEQMVLKDVRIAPDDSYPRALDADRPTTVTARGR
jgi:hypothetical protein